MNDSVIDLKGFHPPPLSSRTVLLVVGGLLAIIMAFSTIYQVQPEEVGIVLRFGAFVRKAEPGLHFKIPFVEQVQKVAVERQLKLEFGFRTEEPGIRTRYSPKQYQGESLMLTGDLNVVVVEWIVQYRIKDPYNYLFKVRHPDTTFRDMNEAVMREVVGDRTVTEVLTVGRQDIETTAEQKLQALADQYDLGIRLDQVVLQDVNPPDPVKPSWDEVNQSQQQRDRMINEARAEYNKVIPRASGEAKQRVLQAQGYALDRVNRAKGDADRFRQLQEAYSRAPEVTRRRMYLETMQKVLPRVGEKIFLDKNARNIFPLLTVDGVRAIATKQRGGGQ